MFTVFNTEALNAPRKQQGVIKKKKKHISEFEGLLFFCCIKCSESVGSYLSKMSSTPAEKTGLVSLAEHY